MSSSAPRGADRRHHFHHYPLQFTPRPSAPATRPAAPPTPLWERVLAWLLALLPLTGVAVVLFGVAFYVTCFALGHRP